MTTLLVAMSILSIIVSIPAEGLTGVALALNGAVLAILALRRIKGA